MASDPSLSRTPPAERLPERTGLVAGIGWNLGSLAFLAVAGIALNVIIGRSYGPETLGTFNIAFALYLLLSQVASFGVQFSTLHAVSTADPTRPGELRQVIRGGAAACLATALVVTAIAFVGGPFVLRLFPSVPDLPKAWLLAAPGLLPFALNKVLLGVINGLQHMRAFAIFQAFRFVLILVFLLLFTALDSPGYALTAVLAAAEFVLLALVGAYVIRVTPTGGDGPPLLAAARRHLSFGARVFPAGMVAELNTRVDVLMLGVYLGDRAAGIYTVAALIYESALQAVIVLRNNINPGLARDIATGAHERILKTSRWIALGMTAVMTAGATTAYLVFPWAAGAVFADEDFAGASAPLLWLMISLPLSAAPLCYGLILSQGNRPGWQSIATLAILSFNVAANALLIPGLGVAGAGLAMGLTGIFAGLTAVVLARYVLGVRLFI